MFLSNIKLWNFRKFGSDKHFDPEKTDRIDLENPDLNLPLGKSLNVLIGENDSGKTAIIDAIKLVLGTHSFEWTRVKDEDFYKKTTRLRIELDFEFLSPDEAKNFTEWIAWRGEGASIHAYLRLNYDVRRNEERIFPADVKAGADIEGSTMSAEAKEYLKVTYLKPLRDAVAELVPRRNSRLAQIFQGHEAFRGKEKDHYLLNLFSGFNKSVKNYFEARDVDDKPLTDDTKGKELKDLVDKYIKSFSGGDKISEIDPAPGSLKSILEKLELTIADEINPGLGSMNRLFMASELVHLNKKSWTGLRLALIEELEAHLHPQVQMQIIESLQRDVGLQIILTTHSPNLASKVKLDNLIICTGTQALPMGTDPAGNGLTALEPNDLKFLECFLDVTKSNLFFAKGVIMVEGWSEELILAPLAKMMKRSGLIQKDLTEASVSVVNVGGKSFLHYSRIFIRRDGREMDVPVAVVTDVDVPVYDKVERLDADGKPVRDSGEKIVFDYRQRDQSVVKTETNAAIIQKEEKYNGNKVKTFVAPQWTLEYCLFKSRSLSNLFRDALKSVHRDIDVNNAESELAKKLINKLDKVAIAYQLARKLEEAINKETPDIVLNENDESIEYLLGAIKHACRV
jgi:putative ATP-dependent endonuclease of the OLD family